MNVFYRCEYCKAVWMMIQGKEKNMTCCEEKVKPLIPGVVDAAVEKHIPVVEVKSNMVNVSVGKIMHPMEKEHYIEWVLVEYSDYDVTKYFKAGEEAVFSASYVPGMKVYAYCNKHGLWMKEID